MDPLAQVIRRGFSRKLAQPTPYLKRRAVLGVARFAGEQVCLEVFQPLGGQRPIEVEVEPLISPLAGHGRQGMGRVNSSVDSFAQVESFAGCKTPRRLGQLGKLLQPLLAHGAFAHVSVSGGVAAVRKLG
jgi:hypothetical protein